MRNMKKVVRRVIANTDGSQFNFTMDPVTGAISIPYGTPSGTQFKYVERCIFEDHSYDDLPEKVFTVP
jgi:hypothetical protein